MLALILQKICNLLGEIKHIRLLVIIKWQMGNSGNKFEPIQKGMSCKSAEVVKKVLLKKEGRSWVGA